MVRRHCACFLSPYDQFKDGSVLARWSVVEVKGVFQFFSYVKSFAQVQIYFKLVEVYVTPI
jgi:hypothetical protein